MRRLCAFLALVLGVTVVATVPAAASGRDASDGAILFVSDRDSTDIVYDDVYALVPGTGETYRLTRDPDLEWQPSMSPDGKSVAFIHIGVTDGVAAPLESAELRVCSMTWRHGRLSCVRERTLVPAGGLAPSTPVSWTADSRSILYGGIDPVAGDGDVFSVGVRNGRLVNLTQESEGEPVAFDGQPNVAADGRSFVYFSSGDIYRRSILGNDPVQLTAGPRADGHPELSPDGRRITFQTTTPGDFDVWVMDARPEGPGNPAVNLTAGRVDASGAPTQERLPTWSPDGRRIAYMWHLEFAANPFLSGFAEGEIYSMRPDGSGVRNETHNNAGDIFPDWGPLPKALARVR